MIILKSLTFRKFIALIGVSLVCAPILFMLLTSLAGSIASKIPRMDFMIPMELFPAVLIGSVLLIWSAIKADLYKKSTIVNFIMLIFTLILSQVIAVMSGLASGKVELKSTAGFIVIFILLLYDVFVIAQCIVGILLFKNLTGNS